MNRWSALYIADREGQRKRQDAKRLGSDIDYLRLTPREAHGHRVIGQQGKARIMMDSIELAYANYNRGPRNANELNGMAEVSCWCERRVVLIEQRLVGKTTLSCGLPGCGPDTQVCCEHCGKEVKAKRITEGRHRGRPRKEHVWCSSSCSTKWHASQRKNGIKPKPTPVFQWQAPPPTEVEMYEQKIEALLAEIKEQLGES